MRRTRRSSEMSNEELLKRKEELLEKEDDWLEREEESNTKWINEGIKIYRDLSRIDSKEIRYRQSLTRLLLHQGEDLKYRNLSYEKAINNFLQVIKLDDTNSRAYYRLGFLYFYQEEWAKSIDSFQQALNTSPKGSSNQLDKEQQVKAHYYILKSTQIISEEVLCRIENIPSEQLELFGEINLIVQEIKEGIGTEGQVKPYQMIVNGKQFKEISENEYEMFSDIDLNPYLIFNYKSMNNTSVGLLGLEIEIPLRQVAILEYLMRHPDGVSSEDLISRLSHLSRNPEAALRKIISRLRTRLRSLNSNVDFIETIQGGYRWSWNREYRMFKHTRDVSTVSVK